MITGKGENQGKSGMFVGLKISI